MGGKIIGQETGEPEMHVPQTCATCSTAILDGDRFCPCCGSPVRHSCPSCGEEVLQAVAIYCPHCGRKLPT